VFIVAPAIVQWAHYVAYVLWAKCLPDPQQHATNIILEKSYSWHYTRDYLFSIEGKEFRLIYFFYCKSRSPILRVRTEQLHIACNNKRE